MTAEIFGHPSSLTTPQAFDRLEAETGRKAVIDNHFIRMVSIGDAYDMVESQSWLGQLGAFPDHGGNAA